MLLGGAALCALASAGFIAIDSIGVALVLLRVLQGLGFSMVMNAGAVYCSRIVPEARMGQALGWFGTAMLCTNAVAPAVCEPLAAAAGWGWVFLLAAVFGVIATLLTTLLPADTPNRSLPSTRTSFWNENMLLVLLASLSVGAGLAMMFTFTQPYAIARGATEVRGLFLGYTAAAVTVRLTLGGWADRVGRQKIAALAMLAYAVTVFASAELQPWALLPLGAMLGVAHGFSYPSLTALVVQSVPDARRGAAMSAFSGTYNAGFAVVLMLLGPVADRVGYALPFATLGILLGGVALLLTRLKPTA
jgi:predicted MFS family arabinose efflux permease